MTMTEKSDATLVADVLNGRLAALGEPAVEPLRTALDDQRDGVRRAAAVALCNRGDCHGLQYVLRLLYAPDWTPSRSHLEQAMEIPGLRASFLEAAAGATRDSAGRLSGRWRR